MTRSDAIQIEEAAYLMLRVVFASKFGSEHMKASQQHFPTLSRELEGQITLRKVRELLEDTKAWRA
jgi:hypothetical protein